MIDTESVSERLKISRIFHKIEDGLIATRRSKTSIPSMDNDVAYLTGVITGDGTMIKTTRKRGGFHYVVKITSDSKKYLDYLSLLFKAHFAVQGRITKDKRKQNTYDLIFQNAAIFSYFVLLGLPIGKKRNLAMPCEINSRELKVNYLAGLVDTDGHAKGNRIQLKQKDGNFLKGLYVELNKLEMNCAIPKINYTNGIPFYYIRFDNKLPLRYAAIAQLVEHSKQS